MTQLAATTVKIIRAIYLAEALASRPTLFEYLPENALLIIDESHVTIPQIGAMYKGDFARKSTLSEYGFACLPVWITAAEIRGMGAVPPASIYVSATPGNWNWNAPAASLPNKSSARPA